MPCVRYAKFTDDDSDVFVLKDKCDNQTINNLCRVDLKTFDQHCFKQIDDKSDFNITGFIELTEHSEAPNFDRICVTKVKIGQMSYGV